MGNELTLDNLYFNCVESYKGISQKIALKLRLKFSRGRKKLEELVKALNGEVSGRNLRFKQLQMVVDDIIPNRNISSHILKENILVMHAEGIKASYVALFNLSNITIKLFADLDSIEELDLQNDVVTEVFSNNTYLISDGKLYIRKFPAMDCLLFAKYN